jgi:hypothetical protein
MRTTLDLDPVVVSTARAHAQARHISIGRAVSEMALAGLDRPAAPARSGARGFPVIHVKDAPRVTGEDVIRFQEGEAAGDIRRVHP